MTDENKGKVVSWMGSWGSATIVLLSGFIVIGSYKADVDTLKTTNQQMAIEVKANTEDLIRLKSAIENFKEGQNEIKSDVKKLLQERRL